MVFVFPEKMSLAAEVLQLDGEAEIPAEWKIDEPGGTAFEERWRRTDDTQPGKYVTHDIKPSGRVEWVAEMEVDESEAERVVERIRDSKKRQEEMKGSSGNGSAIGDETMKDPQDQNPNYTAFGKSGSSFEANCNNFTASICHDLGAGPPERDADLHPGIDVPFGPKEWEEQRRKRSPGKHSSRGSKSESGQAD